MYIYVYVYTYTYIYVCVYIYIHIYIHQDYMCVFMHTHIYIHMYMYIYVNTYICACVCANNSQLRVCNKQSDVVTIYFLQLVAQGIGSVTPFLLFALHLLVRGLSWALRAALLRYLFSKQSIYTYMRASITVCMHKQAHTKSKHKHMFIWIFI